MRFEILETKKGQKKSSVVAVVGPTVPVGRKGTPRELKTQREAIRFGYGCNVPLKGRGAAKYVTKRGRTIRARKLA